MAFNFCKLNFLRRMMSMNINTKLVESLKELPIASKLGDINEVLQAAPELNNYDARLFQETYDFLRGEGFKGFKYAFMITQNPKLLITPKDKLFTLLNDWRALQFGDRDTLELLERYPELLNFKHTAETHKKFETLKQFVGGGSKLYKLILNAPTVINQSLPDLNEKINYFKNVMKVDPVEVYKSDSFSYDITTIKTRHIFLNRLGLYIVKKKKDPNEMSKNPKLAHIYDTSDKRFATKVCHVTLDEYETFQELYKKELDDELAEESSDDEDYGHDNSSVVQFDFGKL